MLKNFQGHWWFGLTALVKVLLTVMATWTTLPSTSSRVIVASQCNNSTIRARQRMQSSSCGSMFNFSCPDTSCFLSDDSIGGETAVCYLDNYINITTAGTTGTIWLLYTTVGAWSPGDETSSIPSIAGEGTRVELSGSVEGSAQVLILSNKDCVLQVNDQDCSCDMVYCPTDQSTARVQGNCTNLGQGHVDACDTVHYGNPGDILRYLVRADSICAQMVSSDDGSWMGFGAPPGEGATAPPSTGVLPRSQRMCFWMFMAATLAWYHGL